MLTTIYIYSMLVASFIASFFTAKVIIRTGIFNEVLSRPARTVTLDGVRGYLALIVFFSHYYTFWTLATTNEWSYPAEAKFFTGGIFAVAIFFMITGYLFIGRITKNTNIEWIPLYIGRFFRIYPLFIFSIIIIFTFSYVMSENPENYTLKEFLKDTVFWLTILASESLGGDYWSYEHATKIIAGVHWTLRYEWMFYLSLPLLSIFFRKSKSAIYFHVAFLLATLFMYATSVKVGPFNMAYIILFAIGGLIQWITTKENIKVNNTLVANLILLASTVYCTAAPSRFDIWHLIAMTTIFYLISSGVDLFGLLKSKSSIILGEISFSIYLIHGIVLFLIVIIFDMTRLTSSFNVFLLFTPLAAILVVLTSVATYKLIENPGIHFGKILGRRFSKRTAS